MALFSFSLAVILAFAWRCWGRWWETCQDSWCPGWLSTRHILNTCRVLPWANRFGGRFLWIPYEPSVFHKRKGISWSLLVFSSLHLMQREHYIQSQREGISWPAEPLSASYGLWSIKKASYKKITKSTGTAAIASCFLTSHRTLHSPYPCAAVVRSALSPSNK